MAIKDAVNTTAKTLGVLATMGGYFGGFALLVKTISPCLCTAAQTRINGW